MLAIALIFYEFRQIARKRPWLLSKTASFIFSVGQIVFSAWGDIPGVGQGAENSGFVVDRKMKNC
jgi:hypothetical protein